jgi:hypothetical protein
MESIVARCCVDSAACCVNPGIHHAPSTSRGPSSQRSPTPVPDLQGTVGEVDVRKLVDCTRIKVARLRPTSSRAAFRGSRQAYKKERRRSLTSRSARRTQRSAARWLHLRRPSDHPRKRSVGRRVVTFEDGEAFGEPQRQPRRRSQQSSSASPAFEHRSLWARQARRSSRGRRDQPGCGVVWGQGVVWGRE